VPGLAGGRKLTIRTCVYAKNHAASMLYWQRFAPAGVTVSVVPVTSTAEILQGLEGGSLDFGLMSPYVPMLSQAKGGVHSKVVAMVARQGFGLIGHKGLVEGIADLKGKTGCHRHPTGVRRSRRCVDPRRCAGVHGQ